MNFTELSAQDFELIEKARRTADELYLKDVHEVAAALRTASGHVFAGIHIEADVGFADVCGEVAAICNMVSAGRRDLDTIVALVREGPGGHRLLAPCGRCREVISVFNPRAWVIVGTLEAPYKVTAAELLPLRFEEKEVN
jgi:cytidine deaminase